MCDASVSANAKEGKGRGGKGGEGRGGEGRGSGSHLACPRGYDGVVCAGDARAVIRAYDYAQLDELSGGWACESKK